MFAQNWCYASQLLLSWKHIVYVLQNRILSQPYPLPYIGCSHYEWYESKFKYFSREFRLLILNPDFVQDINTFTLNIFFISSVTKLEDRLEWCHSFLSHLIKLFHVHYHWQQQTDRFSSCSCILACQITYLYADQIHTNNSISHLYWSIDNFHC